MDYARIVDGEVQAWPYTLQDFQTEFPQMLVDWNSPADLAPLGIVLPIEEDEPAELAPGEYTVLADPVMEEGVCIRNRVIMPPIVPARITMRQARLALLGAGLLDQVEPFITALPSPQREAAQIEWEYAAAVERSNALIAAIGTALELDEAAIDALFITAAGL